MEERRSMTKGVLERALGIQRELSKPGEETCLVSHPDAGGPCERLASMQVWALPFCEFHSTEAERAALNEVSVELDGEMAGLRGAECERHLSSSVVIEALAWPNIKHSPIGRTLWDVSEQSHVEVLRAAYPPIEGRAYDDGGGVDCC
jgi:hypothetical protein